MASGHVAPTTSVQSARERNLARAAEAAAPKQKRSRLHEPSTAAGAGVTLAALVQVLPAHWQPYGYGVAGVLGVVAGVLRERGH